MAAMQVEQQLRGIAELPTTVLQSLLAELDRTVSSAVGTQGRDVLMGVGHPTIIEAVLADLVDVIPVVGDVANVLRVRAAAERGPEYRRQALPPQLLDFVGGLVPGIGDVLDVLSPTNTLLYLQSALGKRTGPPA